jgi:hypothetical protein
MALGCLVFGKVVSIPEGSAWIKYFETDSAHPWDLESVETFDNPLKAIADYVMHSRELEVSRSYNRAEAIDRFLQKFPSERKNLEEFLAQSLPKYRWASAYGISWVLDQSLNA